MPAKSKAQQRFMGMVHAFNKGELKGSEVSKQVKDVAKSMKKKDTKDFAKTKHKGLPNKVKQELIQKLREMVREELKETSEAVVAQNESGIAFAIILRNLAKHAHKKRMYDKLKKKKRESVNEKMRPAVKKLLKQKGYGPIFQAIDNSKKQFKQMRYSRGEIQDTLIDMFGKDDPKILQKIKESINEDIYIGYYKNKKVKVRAKSDKEAQKQIVKKLKIPKKDYDIASLQNWTKTKHNKQKFESIKEAHNFTIKYKKKDGSDYYLKMIDVRANDFKDAVRKALGKLKSKEEKVIVSVSQDTKKDFVVEGVRAIKAFGKVHKARNEFLERYAKLKKQLNTLKTESPNNEFLRLEKQLYKFETAFIEESSKLLGSVAKIAKSNLTESVNEEDGIAKGKGVQKIFDIHKNGYGKLGGRMVDALSAGLFVQLYDKAPDNIKEKMNKMNEKRLYIVIGKMWDKFGKNVRLS